MANYFTPFSLRVSEELIEKLKYLAKRNKRSANKELEYILEQYIENYESKNGVIPLNETPGKE